MVDTTFEKLFQEQYTNLYSYALQITGDEECSRDLVSETFAVLWKTHEDLDETRWKSFIYRTVHNKCIDHLRRNAAHANYANYYLSVSQELIQDSPDAIDLREQRIQTVQEALKDLPERTQFIINQSFFAKRKYADIAGELEISESAVKKHVIKALTFFRSVLALKENA